MTSVVGRPLLEMLNEALAWAQKIWVPTEGCECHLCISRRERTLGEMPPTSTGEPSEQLAQWMVVHSLATGHGDKFADLLNELEWQIAELRTGEGGTLAKRGEA